jgi:hypothetical protein
MKSATPRYNAKELLEPESHLEQLLLEDEEFVKGLYWGQPRFGHPEGLVLLHVREVLDNIDKLDISKEDRARLRLIAFAHDTFKFREDKNSQPRNWQLHHGVLARKFMENFIHSPQVLETLELHDEAYYSWRMIHLYGKKVEGLIRLQSLLLRVESFLQLYYLFFKCDTCTGDKNPAPLKWFESTVKDIEKVELCPHY